LNTQQRIEAAHKRISELEQLIKLWGKDEIDKRYISDQTEPTLTTIILSQKKKDNSYG
tara:strand:+ start:2297 stop:2470 length:174 start_codon:yes stop_codon:yes gene_type:complete